LNEDGLPFVDIVEEYHSDEEKKESTRQKKKRVDIYENFLKVE
jgi:hypothetical protein